jgi:hypothetical protein
MPSLRLRPHQIDFKAILMTKTTNSSSLYPVFTEITINLTKTKIFLIRTQKNGGGVENTKNCFGFCLEEDIFIENKNREIK